MSTETKKFEFKINASPHLKMDEITKRLFNRNFLSDVQFSVEGKIIYAHSLELMKRSEVFEQQLEGTMGEKKLIPVNDCKYENFYQFIRFIYTDECNIDKDNGIEVLKLATKYKVLALENRIISFDKSVKWKMEVFEHCIRDKNDIPLNYMIRSASCRFSSWLTNEKFKSLHPSSVEALLKLESVSNDITELEIFEAVADWIVSYCKSHKITLSEERHRFENIIKKIRFPIIPVDKLRKCVTKYPGILSETDCMSIAHQAVFGGIGNDLWISKCREVFISPYVWFTSKQFINFETIISVSKETILHGLRIGNEKSGHPVEIKIREIDVNTHAYQLLTFEHHVNNQWRHIVINLGSSIILKPNFRYTINIKYLDKPNESSQVRCRDTFTELIVHDPGNAVAVILATVNMMEMFFKQVEQ